MTSEQILAALAKAGTVRYRRICRHDDARVPACLVGDAGASFPGTAAPPRKKSLP